jgi:fumarate reductase subunit D
MSDVPAASATTVACWILVGFLRGDYRTELSDEASWMPGWTVYTGILNACFTWLFSTPVVLLVYAVLVSHGWIDANPIMAIEEGAKVSPALEIQVALLIVMTAWRGLYFGFRDGVI